MSAFGGGLGKHQNIPAHIKSDFKTTTENCFPSTFMPGHGPSRRNRQDQDQQSPECRRWTLRKKTMKSGSTSLINLLVSSWRLIVGLIPFRMDGGQSLDPIWRNYGWADPSSAESGQHNSMTQALDPYLPRTKLKASGTAQLYGCCFHRGVVSQESTHTHTTTKEHRDADLRNPEARCRCVCVWVKWLLKTVLGYSVRQLHFPSLKHKLSPLHCINQMHVQTGHTTIS